MAASNAEDLSGLCPWAAGKFGAIWHLPLKKDSMIHGRFCQGKQ